MKCPVRLHVKCTWRRYTCTWHNGQRRCTAADASIHAPSRLRTHIETCLKIVCTLKNLRRRGCARSRAPPLDPPLTWQLSLHESGYDFAEIIADSKRTEYKGTKHGVKQNMMNITGTTVQTDCQTPWKMDKNGTKKCVAA